MRRWPNRFLVMIGTMLAMLMPSFPAGAQSGTPAANPAYTAAFADARAEATSDLEREILADDIITKAEYDKATHKFVDCLQDHGAGTEITVEADPLIPDAAIVRGTIAPNVPPEIRARIIEECATGTTAIIEPLFITILVNPANTDLDALTLACLRDHAPADAPITAQELPALRTAASSATARQPIPIQQHPGRCYCLLPRQSGPNRPHTITRHPIALIRSEERHAHR